MQRAFIIALAAAALGACAAPQQPGAVRIGYAGMATLDGATGGTIVGGLGCAMVSPTAISDRALVGCMVVGAVAGAGTTLYGTLTTKTEPSFEYWLLIPAPTVGLIIAGLKKLFD